jgi:hypothetical protein
VGAGRKPKGDVAGVSHLARERVDLTTPVRVTLKTAKDIPDLRGKKTQPVILSAIAEGNGGPVGFRVLKHFVERDRLVLIVEAEDTAALSRGMKGFNVRFARNLNRVLGRVGAVLSDRYGSETLKSAAEIKRVLRGAPPRE